MNSEKRPFEIKLTNISEVRMGSPYNSCEIEFVGFDRFKLPHATWQDKYAWSLDSKQLVLIMWSFENNDPGFHLFAIDIETNRTKESPRISGLPKSISLSEGKIILTKFLYNKEKSTQEKLCCEVNEEYGFFV